MRRIHKIKAAKAKNDEDVLHTLRNVSDLIATEAKYHKACSEVPKKGKTLSMMKLLVNWQPLLPPKLWMGRIAI